MPQKPKLPPNVALKAAIFAAVDRHGNTRRQRDIAVSARISETRLSHIVRGRARPTDKEQARLATALNIQASKLFPRPPRRARPVVASSETTATV